MAFIDICSIFEHLQGKTVINSDKSIGCLYPFIVSGFFITKSSIQRAQRAQDEAAGFDSTLMHSGSDAYMDVLTCSLRARLQNTWTETFPDFITRNRSFWISCRPAPRPIVWDRQPARTSHLLGSSLALADVTWSDLTKLYSGLLYAPQLARPPVAYSSLSLPQFVSYKIIAVKMWLQGPFKFPPFHTIIHQTSQK